ncbi:hypothetical protein CHGG_10786 [Chaetomium globosum CBS 148.51]|uniref:Protein kinase domain-containing protein n=1 Tax=Chaetomium globosum (strain ATCC 6205 / CBS 148.51 / DSM 1962 / NBRC 6347 / NRRL 1970) TaxID=306901 RepID=Q2GML8_CHAGB|nr:uncharacterized protein CHGG_10786 [Chaetomium globosum CBS 148.51]EAQ82968.1 hypothetical protein CHGG_10786 [Chaetomium globosum CBS 148.51]
MPGRFDPTLTARERLHRMLQLEWLSRTTRLLRSLLDTGALPPDVLALDLSPSGEVLWTSTEDEYNGAPAAPITVVSGTRFRSCAAASSPTHPAHRLARCRGAHGAWVVGFTTPFVSARSLEKPLPGPFKLRWLRELMGLVDELNLEYGIVHQHIAPRNLFINPDTDSILLFDFSAAAQMGKTWRRSRAKWRSYTNFEERERNDITGVAYFLYMVITRDPAYRFIRFDAMADDEFDDLAKWTQHPQFTPLDHPLAIFHAELTAWIRKRRAQAAAEPEPDQPKLPNQSTPHNHNRTHSHSHNHNKTPAATITKHLLPPPNKSLSPLPPALPPTNTPSPPPSPSR